LKNDKGEIVIFQNSQCHKNSYFKLFYCVLLVEKLMKNLVLHFKTLDIKKKFNVQLLHD